MASCRFMFLLSLVVLITPHLAFAGNVVVRNGQLNVSGGFYSDSDTFYVDSENNRVGIGTTSPGSSLHLYKSDGTARFQLQGNQSATLHQDTGGDDKFLTGLRDDVSGGNYVFYSYGGNWVFDSGRVGIGTTNPQFDLDVDGNITSDFYRFDNNTNDDDKYLYSPSDGILRWTTHNSASGHAFEVSHQDILTYWHLDTTGNSYYNGTAYIGIGTSSPVDTLTVAGWVGLRPASGGSEYLLATQEPDSYAFGMYQAGGDNLLRFKAYGGNDNILVLRSDGNVGINTTDPAFPLTVTADQYDIIGVYRPSSTVSDGSGIDFGAYDNNSEVTWYAGIGSRIIQNTDGDEHGGLVVFTKDGAGYTEKVRIDHLGNVGIGTTTPEYALDVDGSMRINGDTSIFERGILSRISGNMLYYANKRWDVSTSGSISNVDQAFRPGDSFSILTDADLPIVVTVENSDGFSHGTIANAIYPYIQSHGTLSATIQVDLKTTEDTWVTVYGPTATTFDTDEIVLLGSTSSFTYPDDFPIKGIRWNISAFSGTKYIRQLGYYHYKLLESYPFLPIEGGDRIYGSLTTDGNLGVGTTGLTSKLTIAGSESTTNGFNSSIKLGNTASGGGNWYLRAGATGTATPAAGFSIGDDYAYRFVINGSGNVGIGTTTPKAMLDVSAGTITSGNIMFIGTGSNNDGFNLLNISRSTGYALSTLIVRGDGYIGIGTGSPELILDVEGDIEIGTGTTGCIRDSDDTTIAGTCSSDIRLKTDIESLEGVLENVSLLRPVKFKWIGGNVTEYGLVAQEVREVMPELVSEDDEGYLRVSYDSKLFMILLESINELKDENDRKDSEIAALKSLVCMDHPDSDYCRDEGGGV